MTTRRPAKLGRLQVPLALVMALIAGSAAAATLNTSAKVQILSLPLTTTGVAQLRFGTLASGDTAGTVEITTDNQRIATGGVVLLGLGNFGPAEFAITGQPDANYTITLPSSVVIERDHRASSEPGVTSLDAIDLTSLSTTLGVEGATGQIGADGSDTVLVGATLQVPTTAKSGNYRGELAISLAYE